MIERIKKNEEKLDKIVSAVRKLENALNSFEGALEDIKNLNKYYGSEEWFRDKEAFEKGEIERIKAGVLSEDAVWNINEKIIELKEKMKEISNINL